MSDAMAWEVDTSRRLFNNVSSALAYPYHKLILSAGEEKTIRVWEMPKRTAVQTRSSEHDRIWAMRSSPVAGGTKLVRSGRRMDWVDEDEDEDTGEGEVADVEKSAQILDFNQLSIRRDLQRTAEHAEKR
ncbi:hypothetical protein CALVIDRAFT_568737 [Calocera viscosa TUFC12733]|uniref:WD40 repeat-like protein n=1 Tax=Calocera viscosa (strain TUFC12733) TaxID=1330018 RepID=A0A167GSQ4_CALVF|nr:hypothetical protein CALVIDRAFT_568737 [Calocera viscosa TUFC12733]